MAVILHGLPGLRRQLLIPIELLWENRFSVTNELYCSKHLGKWHPSEGDRCVGEPWCREDDILILSELQKAWKRHLTINSWGQEREEQLR